MAVLSMKKKKNSVAEVQWGDGQEVKGGLVEQARQDEKAAQEAVRRYVDAIRQRKNEITELNQQIIDIETGVDIDNMDKSVKQLSALRGRVEALTGIVENLEKQILEPKAHLQACEKKRQKLERELQYLPGQIENAKSNFKRAEYERDKLVDQLRRYNNQVQEKENHVNSLEKRLTELQG